MPKSGPKPKPQSTYRHNPVGYHLRTRQRMPAETVFDQNATNYLQVARGEDSDAYFSDSDDWKDDAVRRRRAWSREQKLGAIQYATTTFLETKRGIKQLISRKAAATNIGCTPKMLREWIKDFNNIYASPKYTRKRRVETRPQEPEMEQQLHKSFLQKQSIGRKIGQKWIERNARMIYADIYPDRVAREEGKLTEYNGFRFSRGWFNGFLKRKHISLHVSIINLFTLCKLIYCIGSYKKGSNGTGELS
jgi:transposase-like protein